MARAATTTDAFNAVAVPRRRQLLDLLAHGEQPVNDLVAHLGLAQPVVSKHLRVLRESGVVRDEVSGRRRIYHLTADGLAPLGDWLAELIPAPADAVWSTRFDALDTEVRRTRRDRSGRATPGRPARPTFPSETTKETA